MTIETLKAETAHYFQWLQVLRGIAALMVVILHVFHEVKITSGKVGNTVPGWLELQYPFGAGVHIFFVLSGFLMLYTSKNLFQIKDGWKTF